MLTFYASGTGMWENYNESVLKKSESFTYKINGTTLTLTSENDIATMTIKEQTDSTLVLLSTYVDSGQKYTETFYLHKQNK
jgi:membrane-bound inhibitor of C-type lysozyme